MTTDSSTRAGDSPAERSSDELSELLDRLTQRLRVDPELRLEVRQELRSHLDDSIAQLKNAGRTDADARNGAVRALGDERELAEQLWKSNRRRIRIRAAVVWASRLLLPPVAALLIIALGYNALSAWAFSSSMWHRSIFHWADPPRARQIADHYRNRVFSRVPADLRPLFERGPDAARRASDFKPDDPALFANYAIQTLNAPLFPESRAPTSRPIVQEPDFSRALEAFVEGERREDDNALYPLMTAALLLRASTFEAEIPDLTDRPASWKRWNGWARLDVADPERYAQAMAAFSRAAGKPHLRTYAADIAKRKVAAIPAGSVSDVWLRSLQEADARSSVSYYLWTVHARPAFAATDAARANKPDDARKLLRDMRLVAGLLASDALDGFQLQQAWHIDNMADEAESRMLLMTGNRAAAMEVHERLENRRSSFERQTFSDDADTRKRRGAIFRAFSQWDDGVPHDPAPMRRAEYASADQLGVAFIATCVLALAGFYALASLSARSGRRDTSSPARLFLGWRRSATIVLVGAVLPLAVYLLYARLTPFAGRQYGIQTRMSHVLIEYGVVLLVVITLLMFLCRRAVQRRARELGLAPSRIELRSNPLTPVTLATLGAVVLAFAGLIGGMAAGLQEGVNVTYISVGFQVLVVVVALISLVMMSVRPRKLDREMTILALTVLTSAIAIHFSWRGIGWMPRATSWLGPFLLLAGAWAVIAAVGTYFAARRQQDQRVLFGGIVARSAFPVVLLSAVALSLIGLPLRWVEHRAVATATGAADQLLFLNRVEQTPFASEQQRLIAQRQMLLTAH